MIRSRRVTISSAFRKTSAGNSVAGRLPRRSASRKKTAPAQRTMPLRHSSIPSLMLVPHLSRMRCSAKLLRSGAPLVRDRSKLQSLERSRLKAGTSAERYEPIVRVTTLDRQRENAIAAGAGGVLHLGDRLGEQVDPVDAALDQ